MPWNSQFVIDGKIWPDTIARAKSDIRSLFVRRAITSIGENPSLGAPPPHVDSSEKSLPRLTRATLNCAQAIVKPSFPTSTKLGRPSCRPVLNAEPTTSPLAIYLHATLTTRRLRSEIFGERHDFSPLLLPSPS